MKGAVYGRNLILEEVLVDQGKDVGLELSILLDVGVVGVLESVSVCQELGLGGGRGGGRKKGFIS